MSADKLRPTDIVVTTCDRLDYLKRTLSAILERTETAYHLHVIDDGSREENAAYLLRLLEEGQICSLLLRKERQGTYSALNVATWMTYSDPVVLVDDDVLCPLVEPDWLARGLAAMGERPGLGLLALNNPSWTMRIEPLESDGIVQYTTRIGGTFVFVRRVILERRPLNHAAGLARGAWKERCRKAVLDEWRIGWLAETYCQHIGAFSVRKGRPVLHSLVEPSDPLTLEPPEEWAFL